jgi:hypothetical protein
MVTDERRDVVVAPGGGWGPSAGFVLYAGEVPARRGGQVHRHWWKRPKPDFAPASMDWVCEEIGEVLGAVDNPALLIGKSLGTLAAPLAARDALPAVWLTPLLDTPWAVSPLRAASAPFLLVGGTADRFWDGTLARQLTPHVLEVEGADHGMLLPGPVSRSVPVLDRVIAAIDEFLDSIGWPPAPDA